MQVQYFIKKYFLLVGAWLNQCPNKRIYAPKFFIGINKRICYPYGLDEGDEVSKWNYIDVDKIRN